MPANNETVFQINLKTPKGTLLNLYIADPELAEPMIRDVMALHPVISEAENLFFAVETASNVLGAQMAPQSPPDPQAPGPAPICKHNMPMQYKSGISKAGNSYKMWVCPTGLKTEQGGCAPQWIK